ncbi:hypothetical protein [Bradyrhizobium diazoefficiens]|uniref:hypothetical protein n=1 Tax=Bradyrhizobium diazoefficiens TaxID=1355477 RepID=UPI0034844CF1
MSAREAVVDYLRTMLIGPGFGEADPVDGYEREVISNRLSLAYMMGLLYPRQVTEQGDLASDELGEGVDEDEDVDADDPLSMAAALLPASMGLSICVSSDALLKVVATAAIYEELPREEKGSPRSWKRRPMDPELRTIGPGGLPRTFLFGGRGTLEALDRVLPDGSRLITISLSNAAETDGHADITQALFQAGLECSPVKGRILPYPSTRFVPPTAEERELRIIYGDQRPFATGHGIATDWSIVNGACTSVRTEALPCAHVWKPVFDKLEAVTPEGTLTFDDPDIFQLCNLASGAIGAPVLVGRLRKLAELYRRWIDVQRLLPVELELQADAAAIVARCERSVKRMEEGISLLQSDPSVYRAFTLANRVMLMSMCHAARAGGRARPDGRQGPFELGEAEVGPIDYFANDSARWRPFQLAFFLQVIPSLVDPSHVDRDVVDVIWFATGGGKTEAYLLAAAFELIRRRLAHGARGKGVGVLNRYTYRFLTADQFQRTAGMICALEILRQQLVTAGDDTLGDEEFSIGLFVGGDVSPNQYTSSYDDRGAHELCTALLEASEPRAANTFPIESCPCCGTLLVPNARKMLPDGTPDKTFYGFESSANSFVTRCPDEDCFFHGHLPLYFIDEQLYSRRPSFLLGTIDKFAMVPWREDAGRLFGAGRGAPLPPSLVIQDELHLISGPLGTLAGIYEGGFDTLVATLGGCRAKVIASTATIRNASAQCRRIYGKDSAVFPSPGIKAEDSFFSRLDVGEFDRSRLYVGIMGQGVRSTIAVSWAMSAILQGVYKLSRDGSFSGDETDAFWTLVAYHNSKRELGRIANATRDEIPTRLKVYAKIQNEERPSRFDVLELKAHAEVPIPQARQALARRHSANEPAVDIAPCTSIISVGIDIERLGLMLVNGQPKLTAEYIQATSRVGRGKVAGLVATCYSPSKPRDRSHYESFRDYHEKFYSFVEPTSVTPGAIPAIERALHAALVTVVRHGGGLAGNAKARDFDPSVAAIADLVAALELRLRSAYADPTEQEERDRISQGIADRVRQWADWASAARSSGSLQYTAAPRQVRPTLLYRFGDPTPPIGWQTLQSMRHVDREILMEI